MEEVESLPTMTEEIETLPPAEEEVETLPAGSVYEWLSGNPLASHAGSTLYGWYEGSKGCSRISDYALDTIESSVKFAAGTAAPLVKKLDRPIHAIDSFAAQQLVKLEDKVPAIKAQPDEVVTYLSESKEAISSKISDGRHSVTGRISEGKDALSSHISSGKDAISSKVIAGKDVIVSTVQSGAAVVATAGVLMSIGVDRTLCATETIVNYILPAEENEKQLLSESEKVKEIEMASLKGVSTEAAASENVDEVAEVEDVEHIYISAGRVDRIKILSRKVKLRLYYRSMRNLHSVQQQSKSTLEQLQSTINVLKIAKDLRDKAGDQYNNVTATLKDLEGHVRQMLVRTAQGDKVEWLPDQSAGEDDEIEWLKPRPTSRLQATLDYAKQLSAKLYSGLGSVSSVTSYLPHQLKDGASQAYDYSKEMYSHLKSVESPTDLSKNALDRISEIVDSQLGYVRQLGTYLTSVLKRGRSDESVAKDIDVEDKDDSDEEENEFSADPSTSQPPGSESDSEDEPILTSEDQPQ